MVFNINYINHNSFNPFASITVTASDYDEMISITNHSSPVNLDASFMYIHFKECQDPYIGSFVAFRLNAVGFGFYWYAYDEYSFFNHS